MVFYSHFSSAPYHDLIILLLFLREDDLNNGSLLIICGLPGPIALSVVPQYLEVVVNNVKSFFKK